MKQSQRDAVYAAVTSVFADSGVDFEDGMNATEHMTKEMRESVCTIVSEGFKAGTIALESTPANAEKLASPAKLNGYVSGLVSNWLRKDTRINGGAKYVAKNPGSRAGSSDPQLKALRQLAVQFKGTDKESAITAQISSRLETIKAEKVKQVKVDISALPAELIATLGLNKQ